MLKAVVEIVDVQVKKDKNGEEFKNVEIAEGKKGKYFNAYQKQYVEGQAGKVFMEGYEYLERGAKGAIDYTQRDREDKPEYPWQNIHAFFPSDESQFPPIDVSKEDEEKYGGASGTGGYNPPGGAGTPPNTTVTDEFTLEEKVNILWKKRNE